MPTENVFRQRHRRCSRKNGVHWFELGTTLTAHSADRVRRSPLPLHRDWADWLWKRSQRRPEIVRLDSQGIVAYRCSPDSEALREDLSMAVGMGTLTLTPEGDTNG